MSYDDIFDLVNSLEKLEYIEGQEEGTKEGKLKQAWTGYTFGWQQACHILHQLGIIEGLLSSLLLNCADDIDPRIYTQINKLLTRIKGWSSWDSVNESSLEALLSSIHMKSRYLLQRMKISSHIEERTVDAEF